MQITYLRFTALFVKICSSEIKCYYEKRDECYEKPYEFQRKRTKTGHDLQTFVLQNCLWVNESQKQVLQKIIFSLIRQYSFQVK